MSPGLRKIENNVYFLLLFIAIVLFSCHIESKQFLKPKHIYIVDDDVEDQEIFCQAVGDVDESISCNIFSSCDEMLIVLEKNLLDAPDIIFLDLNMPKIGGKECLSLLKKDLRFQNIPVYIYTTTSFAKEKEQAMKLGAAGFIVKPNSLKLLKKHLDEILLPV